MQDFEKLGTFYLGKVVDPSKGTLTNELLLYDSKNLTTHAVCIGMTGSGKTGLGIAILEEAAIDRIPAIIIDPKGDMGNLCLTFPDLSAREFLPWIDPSDAEREGMDVQSYSEKIAKKWKDGLASWGESAARIQKLRSSVDIVIYTPASTAGVPLSILSSFAAPPPEILMDSGAMRERVLSTSSSLLNLIGINADPIKSREQILLSTIIDLAWREKRDLNLTSLIEQVQNPPFDKIGALDVETFFPRKERLGFSISLNNLLASPGFSSWMEGEPLDCGKLLHNKEGKPQLSIISIAHLSDPERMFFVTLLLNQLLSWMRRQTGTSSLRALLYMDEIFGYFPPTSMPPSKIPMLTLLKQARAYGLGIVLASQNAVDLDYKGLSNCGSWFIGKLQTEKDKKRLLEGLRATSGDGLSSGKLDKMLALLGNRTFIMRTVTEKEPVLFQTRWTLSYLRGPLTLVQISSLVEKPPATDQSSSKSVEKAEKTVSERPVVSSEIPQFFASKPPSTRPAHYRFFVVGTAKLHFVQSKNKVDEWQEVSIIAAAAQDGKSVRWDEGKCHYNLSSKLGSAPNSNSSFDELPAGLMQSKNYLDFAKTLAASLYQNQTLTLFFAPKLQLRSNIGESEGDFRARLNLTYHEKRDEKIEELRKKYEKKMNTLTDREKRAQEKVAQKKQKATLQKTDTAISFGTTLLGALFGKGVKGTIAKAGSSIKQAGRIGKENQDLENAEEELQTCQKQLEEFQDELKSEIDKISSADNIELEKEVIRPRKSDISVEKVGLLWWQV